VGSIELDGILKAWIMKALIKRAIRIAKKIGFI